MSNRTYLDHDARRQSLVDAAVRVFNQGGFEGITNAAVAAEAGVSRALVYSFFPDNPSLMQAFLDDRLTNFRSLVESLATDMTNPLDRTAAALHGMIQKLSVMELRSLKAVLAAGTDEQRQPIYDSFVAFVTSRWENTIDMSQDRTALKATILLFIEILISMALIVKSGDMTSEQAEGVARAMTAAALAQIP